MDPVEKKAPVVVNADQNLVENTGGKPGIDNSIHPEEMRARIKEEVGENVTPKDELAEKKLEENLGEAEKAGFLKNVVGVQEEGTPNQSETPDSSLDLNKLGEHLNAFSPIGEDNDRGMPSTEPNKIELERQKKRGVVK